MQCFSKNEPVRKCRTAVALGFFDGVHLGHRAVISATAECSTEGFMPVVYTFSKNPKFCISGNDKGLIITDCNKKRIIDSLGIERLYTVDFNTVRELSYQNFVSEILYKTLNAGRVFCGFNYRFGVNGSGNAELLKQECERYGIVVTVIPPVIIEETVVSSTEIRNALASGNIRKANLMLGRRFGYCGTIIHGRKLGHELGTPTINQRFQDGVIVPKFGVYASIVNVAGGIYKGVTNIGMKPTVGSSELLSETWLIDYSGGSLYDQNADVELLEFLRPETFFNSVEELKNAIMNDAKKAAALNSDW